MPSILVLGGRNGAFQRRARLENLTLIHGGCHQKWPSVWMHTYCTVPSMALAVLSGINDITSRIIGAAIEVHRTLGPGLLESSYRECFCRELLLRRISFQREYGLPLKYKGIQLDCGYRIDVLVDGLVVLELKAVEALAPIHDAQLLTYMRLGGWKVGLLINFNVVVLKDGIHRKVL